MARVSHETIYRFLQDDRRNGGRLYRHLRHGHRKRRKRYGAPDRRGRIRDQVMIDQRPAIIDQRGRVGDWEIDTVHGRGRSGSVVTIVERLTGMTVVGKVADRRAETVTHCSVDLLEPLSDHVHSITADNGKEFADHQRLDAALDARIYFAHPYHAWERGTNENTNGLLRQFLPKGTDFRRLDQRRCDRLADRLNDRPRKRLGYLTPREAFLVLAGTPIPRTNAQGRPMGRPWAQRIPINLRRMGVALRN